jgi:hypothetical protein
MTLASQLRQAWQGKGITLDELCELAALECSADSLSRKLAEKQILTTREAERLADALDAKLHWPAATRKRRAA